LPNLILIRHSISQPDSTVPSSEWRLTAEGRDLCRPLAHALAPWKPERLICSMEPKAVETAQLTAAEMGVPSGIAAGLHEHDRSNVPYLGSQEAFRDQVANMFTHPDQVVFGMESANQALERFSTAVRRLQDADPGETLALVTHGTVMSLFAGKVLREDAQTIWSKLGMPAYIVFSIPDHELMEMVASISAAG
jgi:broad specificity phosphatase PhoE